MKGKLRILALVLVVLAGTACNASRVSGTYVAHTRTFAEMLQLTQTADGKISGVLSTVELKQDGSVDSKQTSVTGTADSGQLTLTFPSPLSFISGTSLAGTISESAIHLQSVSNGQVSTEEFVRGTPDEFNRYTAELKTKGEGIALSTKLLNGAQELREAVHNAEGWIANAKMHVGRIPNAKTQYDKIEDDMNSLLACEQVTSNAVIRSQISVALTQDDIAGEQVDIQLEQVWDIGIGDSGARLSKEFTSWAAGCAPPEALQKRGASEQAVESWETACKQALAERDKFMPILKRTMEQRADLKSFEAAAATHRKALVADGNRLQ